MHPGAGVQRAALSPSITAASIIAATETARSLVQRENTDQTPMIYIYIYICLVWIKYTLIYLEIKLFVHVCKKL